MNRIAAAAVAFSLVAATALADVAADRTISARLDAASLRRTTEHLDIRFDPTAVTPEQADRFASLAEAGARGVAAFTNCPVPPRVDIYVVGTDLISHTFPHWPGSSDRAPRMFLSARRVTGGTAPYLHEMVHAVVGDGGAMWLEEGYASWVASEVSSRYGGYYAPVLSEGNETVDRQAANILRTQTPDQVARELDWIRGDAEPSFALDEERTSFYILAHSFTKYLASQVGTAALTQIHRADDIEELARRTGRTSASWRSEWIRTIAPDAGGTMTLR